MSTLDGLEPTFADSLNRLIADSGGRVYLTSGYRSEDEQAALYADAVSKYGEEQAGWYVAPPGASNHGKGIAADIQGDMEWLAQNAAAYGLYLPMSWEPWHVEPLGSRDNSNSAAYTTSPELRYRDISQPLTSRSVDPFSIVKTMLGGEPDPLYGADLDSLFTYQPLASLTSLSPLFSSATPFQVPEITRGVSSTSTLPATTTRPQYASTTLPDRSLGGSDIDRFMFAIRSVESGHNYSAINPSSGASGAYQFMRGTWGGYGGYSEARDAPPEVQDEFARRLMLSYFAQFQNWSDVASAWVSGPNGHWASEEVQTYARNVIGAM